MSGKYLAAAAVCFVFIGFSAGANAAPVTNPNDPRNWQGATVGTFAQLFFGSNTAATRQQVIDAGLLDDGIFNTGSATGAAMISAVGVAASGYSFHLGGPTPPDPYGYTIPSPLGVIGAGSAVDNHWVQTDNIVGHSVWDLGAPSNRAAIFNTIDHGPLPQEAIESTVYLSNDQVTWTPAVTQKVWLEGFMTDLNVLWDGFAYVVGTPTNDPFRYASIIWGGPGGLQADGDNEINGVLGLDPNFVPVTGVPEPATLALLGVGLLGLGIARRRQRA
jgi:hypothetical protein